MCQRSVRFQRVSTIFRVSPSISLLPDHGIGAETTTSKRVTMRVSHAILAREHLPQGQKRNHALPLCCVARAFVMACGRGGTNSKSRYRAWVPARAATSMDRPAHGSNN